MMKKPFAFLMMFTTFLLIPGGAAGLEVHLSDDTLTVRASRMPLQQILRQIARQGIKIEIDPRINPHITANFRGEEVQRALEKLIRPYSHVLVWEKGSGSGETGHRLSEIRIFEPGKAGQAIPLGSSTTLNLSAHPHNGTFFVADELLLKILPGLGETALQQIVKQIGGRVISVNRGTGIYRILVNEETDIPALADRISKFKGVAGAEPNWVYGIPSPVALPGSAASSDELPDISAMTGGIPVAVLDSGLRPDVDLVASVIASVDIFSPGDPISDAMGHGTQMALIASGTVNPQGALTGIQGLNPVVPIKVFDENGNTSSFHILESIDFALNAGARVMSLSWGSTARSQFLEKALGKARSTGLFIVASAGNDPTGEPVYPAAYPAVVGVGALEADGKRWKNSNYGEFVRVYAPGIAKLPVGYNGAPGIYAGTSIAAAYTAHLIAVGLSQQPDAGLQEIFEELLARPSGQP